MEPDLSGGIGVLETSAFIIRFADEESHTRRLQPVNKLSDFNHLSPYLNIHFTVTYHNM